MHQVIAAKGFRNYEDKIIWNILLWFLTQMLTLYRASHCNSAAKAYKSLQQTGFRNYKDKILWNIFLWFLTQMLTLYQASQFELRRQSLQAIAANGFP